MKYDIILELFYIPNGSIVRKLTGNKRYKVQDSITV